MSILLSEHIQQSDNAHVKQQVINYIKQSECQAVWSYKIPELGEGGACSLFGQLQAAPFNLLGILEKQDEAALISLSSIVEFIKSEIGVDWFGIYQIREVESQSQLVKLAYFGKESRPLFPLTQAFAEISNNVSVALNNEGRIINNVTEYVAKGGEYYTCDPKIKSELCLPIVNEQGTVIGIIDAESYQQDFFTPQRQKLFTTLCQLLPFYLPKKHQN